MSQADVEIVQRAMDAFNRLRVLSGPDDPLPWLREFCDPDVELDLSRRGIDPGIYYGFAGLSRLRAQDSDVWQESRFEAEEVIDAGDRILLFTRNSGIARSGVSLSVRVGHVLTLRNGKIVRWQYVGENRSAALKAVGLEE